MTMKAEIDYLHLSMAEAIALLHEVEGEVEQKFGALNGAQLNWKPSAESWSVAQCLEHLLVANSEYYPVIDAVIAGTYPRSIWQRFPGWSGMWGKVMINSLTPSAARKLKAPAAIRPSASVVDARVVERFVADQTSLVARFQSLASRGLEAQVVSSPFVKAITYTLLDAGRLIVAHQHRHLAQAERVMQTPGFPVLN